MTHPDRLVGQDGRGDQWTADETGARSAGTLSAWDQAAESYESSAPLFIELSVALAGVRTSIAQSGWCAA